MGLDGLVGKKYPGSTGGEIFNYYGTDSFANTAAGSYCTTIGRGNKNKGEQNFIGGFDNSIVYTGGSHCDNNFIFGKTNRANAFNSSLQLRNSVILGANCEIKNRANVGYIYLIGSDNEHAPSSNTNTGPCMAVGSNLSVIKDQYAYGCNNATPSLTDTHLILASSTPTGTSINAIEANETVCKVCTSLRLASGNTGVNAITPALSDPASADDQTLATKSYVDSQIPVVPSIPTDLVLATSYAISTGNETLTPNTPVTLATIVGDNDWVFPYSSGTLKVFFKYPLISRVVCEATFLIDGTTTSGTVYSPFSYCMNNGHDVGYIRGGLICLDYSTMSLELKYGEGIDVNNIDEAITDAYTDNSTTATLVRIHCTNLY